MKLPSNSNLEKVYKLIPYGIEIPITATEISKITGISKREIYSILNTLIMKYEKPIAGVRNGKSGYFIVTNEEERTQALKPLKNHTANMVMHIKKLESIKL